MTRKPAALPDLPKPLLAGGSRLTCNKEGCPGRTPGKLKEGYREDEEGVGGQREGPEELYATMEEKKEEKVLFQITER